MEERTPRLRPLVREHVHLDHEAKREEARDTASLAYAQLLVAELALDELEDAMPVAKEIRQSVVDVREVLDLAVHAWPFTFERLFEQLVLALDRRIGILSLMRSHARGTPDDPPLRLEPAPQDLLGEPPSLDLLAERALSDLSVDVLAPDARELRKACLSRRLPCDAALRIPCSPFRAHAHENSCQLIASAGGWPVAWARRIRPRSLLFEHPHFTVFFTPYERMFPEKK